MLSDMQCRRAKCPDGRKQIKLTDGKGLYLLVTAAGGRYWRWDYRYQGKRKTLALGVYPEVGLSMARERRDAARARLEEGIDPATRRQAGSNSFAIVAAEYIEHQRDSLSAATIANLEAILRLHILPRIGGMDIDSIEPPELLALARRLESSGKNETAHRAISLCSRVLRYAIATGRARRDPTQDLRGALKPVVVRHRPAVTEPAQLTPMLRKIWTYHGTIVVATALRMIARTFVRGRELRFAEWREIDWQAAEWRIPAARMKMRRAHIVPLARQQLDDLRALQVFTGHARLIFPGARSHERPISENTLNAALRSMDITPDQQVAHGFRAMARTLLAERGWMPDIIEAQLAHAKSGPLGAAYDRARYLPERRKMMQDWADYLDDLRERPG